MKNNNIKDSIVNGVLGIGLLGLWAFTSYVNAKNEFDYQKSFCDTNSSNKMSYKRYYDDSYMARRSQSGTSYETHVKKAIDIFKQQAFSSLSSSVHVSFGEQIRDLFKDKRNYSSELKEYAISAIGEIIENTFSSSARSQLTTIISEIANA